MDRPLEFIDITPMNPLISKCKIKVCYVGEEPNRNRSVITKEVAKDMANSLPGCPIVGFYNESTQDFEEHNRVIDISNGKFQIKDTTRPYGFVPTDARVWFEWFEDDGVSHEYLMTEGYIWTGQYPESQRVIERGNNQSMELDEDTLDAHWTKDNNGKPEFFIINEAIMSKLCILGEDVEPCFEGASVTKFAFEDDFKEKVYSMITQIQEILEKGGTPVFTTYAVEIGESLWSTIYGYIWDSYGPDEDYLPKYSVYGIYEEGEQKFVVLVDRKALKYYRLNFTLSEENGFVPDNEMSEVAVDFKPVEPQFAAEDVQAYEVTFAAERKEGEQVEEQPAEEEPVAEKPEAEPEEAPEAKAEEPVEEDAESAPEAEEQEPQVEPEQELQEESAEEPAKYNLDEVVEYQELLAKYAELESKVEDLNRTIENLTSTNKDLAEFKLTIDREKKKDLIKSFYMLSDDLKEDCINNIDKYSYDEIEAKLCVICVRNKVNFNLDTHKEETTFNLDDVNTSSDDNMPGWVKRVNEVAKEKNIK